MPITHEIRALKTALDELIDAHDSFDHAVFNGEFHEIGQANGNLESALRRAKLASRRFEDGLSELRSLESVVHGPEELAGLERMTRLMK